MMVYVIVDRRTVKLGLLLILIALAASVGAVAAQDEPENAETLPNTEVHLPVLGNLAPGIGGRMTGGGRIQESDVTHGLELHCSESQTPNNLQVNWHQGDTFHLETLDSVMCSDDSNIDATPPAADFDTLVGSGTGRLNGEPGAMIRFKFTDAGQPGKNDQAEITIWDTGGNTVLSVSGNLHNGNHQSHGGGEQACDVLIEVQNAGENPTQAMILSWSDPGACPDCSGPVQVECSGLLAPGATWHVAPPQIPAGADNAVVFSLSAEQAGDEVFADAVCDKVSALVTNSCDKYLLFKQAFDEGGVWQGLDFGTYTSEPLAVDVIRACETGATGAPLTSAYSGIRGKTLGARDPIFGGYAYYAPSLYADFDGLTSHIYIQNAGLECTSVEFWLKTQGECIRSVIDEIPALAPGETYEWPVEDAGVGPFWRGSAWIRAAVPVAIAVDHVGDETLMTYRGTSAELNYTFDPNRAFFTSGSQVNFAPLTYRVDQGWETKVEVQNLSSVLNADVKIYFYDDKGNLITYMEDWICPRGSRTFSLPVTDTLPGTDTGWVKVVSLPWFSPGDPIARPPNIASVVSLRRWDSPDQLVSREALSYPTLPASHVVGVSRAFLPVLLQDLTGAARWTSEMALTNFNHAPGETNFRIDVHDENGVVGSLYRTLDAGQMTTINWADEGLIGPGFKGSVVIEAESTTQGTVAFGAVNVFRHGGSQNPSPSPDQDARGDQTAAVTAWPDTDAPLLNNDPLTFSVTNTNDSGPGSLRQAILNANANPATDTIAFNIPGAGSHTIGPTSALPMITDPVMIDASTQPGFVGSPIIELDGSNAGASANGLYISGGLYGFSLVRGLAINRFVGHGVLLETNGRIMLADTYIGTDLGGTADRGNGGDGIHIRDGAEDNLIAPNTIIAFNGGDGVHIAGGTGTSLWFSTIFANGGDGVHVAAGTGHLIFYGSTIFANAGLGIDLGGDGVTPNDTGDPDTGANNRQNYPVLTKAVSGAGTTTIEGEVNSTPGTGLEILFYANETCDPSGFGEGQTYLGSTFVVTDGNGDADFVKPFPVAIPVGHFVTATASDLELVYSSDTSEFSQCVEVGPAP